MTNAWRQHPPIALPVPIMAMLAGADGVWAAGPGGIARYSDRDGWIAAMPGFPLRSVTALVNGGALLAAGSGGIARSTDDGRTWNRCTVPDGAGMVTALAASPAFAQDGTALAATIDSGILRSTDGGRTWQALSFGLQSPEVLALTWGSGEAVFAATSAGLHRSPNAGRAWRIAPWTSEAAFTALAVLPDGDLLAAPEVGPPLRSSPDLGNWSPLAGLPDEVRVTALLPMDDGTILLGTADHGLLLSNASCAWHTVSTETVLCFATNEAQIYAGTSTGVIVSENGGETWTDLTPPPLHDLRRLLIVDSMPLLFGSVSPPVVSRPNGEWKALDAVPMPLTALVAAPDGALLASTPNGLFRSADHGASWELLVAGKGGCVTQMTFASEGRGWAGVTADGALLRTADAGCTWERLPSPFGILSLVALQAFPGSGSRPGESLFAATYDERQRAVGVWRFDDGGARWSRGADSYTPWPTVATSATPPLMAIGNVITARQPDGAWRQDTVGETGFRRVVGDGTVVLALATDGLWRSDDQGGNWARDDGGLPLDQVLDVALDGGLFYALLSGGRLWTGPQAPSRMNDHPSPTTYHPPNRRS